VCLYRLEYFAHGVSISGDGCRLIFRRNLREIREKSKISRVCFLDFIKKKSRSIYWIIRISLKFSAPSPLGEKTGEVQTFRVVD